MIHDQPFLFLENVKSVNTKGEKEQQEKKEGAMEKEQNKYVAVN